MHEPDSDIHRLKVSLVDTNETVTINKFIEFWALQFLTNAVNSHQYELRVKDLVALGRAHSMLVFPPLNWIKTRVKEIRAKLPHLCVETIAGKGARVLFFCFSGPADLTDLCAARFTLGLRAI
jgi:hypothetical protein